MADTAEVPLFFYGGVEEHARKLALAQAEILLGKTNNRVEVTLLANEVETDMENERFSQDTVLILSPKSATAATAIAAGVVYFEANRGVITIHHDSQPDTDRTFGAVYVG